MEKYSFIFVICVITILSVITSFHIYQSHTLYEETVRENKILSNQVTLMASKPEKNCPTSCDSNNLVYEVRILRDFIGMEVNGTSLDKILARNLYNLTLSNSKYAIEQKCIWARNAPPYVVNYVE